MNMEIPELQQFLEAMGQQKFRAKQIFQWIGRGVREIDDMTDLSRDLREKLKLSAHIGSLNIRRKLVSKIDGTAKYLFELTDGNVIESVLMRYKYGHTVCISSQIGCKMGCKFCASTQAGFMRDMTAGEMLDQVVSIGRDAGEKIGNIVIMGIGEPFDNYDNVIKFLRLIHDPNGMDMGYRHMTVSTCGLAPQIARFTGENMPVNLAVSLHAPDDKLREAIMPIGRKYSIDKLIEACKIYTEASGRRITFEYAMISGVNDSLETARKLALLLKGMFCHVNLIPANLVAGSGFDQSSKKHLLEFKEALVHSGIETTVRRELGSDINAACGQLRRSEMEKNS
ncbi:MAG: 23S rRNA (adenine(2503)-C(2))-methyltransferase RlmN [Ruminiclostridium sp.]|nr:23S rRNA (adenine(2503)-C(2))-methyltransferase RlmN [Ruminiclostridium sp.]